MSTKKTFATVNWANMNESFDLLSTFQKSVNELALAEIALKKVKDANKGKSKEDLKKATENERLVKKNAFDRAEGFAIAFITRYISTTDVLSGHIYNFDMVDFLKNIGVLSEGEVDKKVLASIENCRALVVDRKKETVTRRKNCNNTLTLGEVKEVKNTPIELVLAIVFCAISSGAIEYSEGGLAFKKFN